MPRPHVRLHRALHARARRVSPDTPPPDSQPLEDPPDPQSGDRHFDGIGCWAMEASGPCREPVWGRLWVSGAMVGFCWRHALESLRAELSAQDD
jgi:hypothetical protein